MNGRMSEDAAPFKFTRESRIRIDADGHVWDEGERVERARLERALASWVDFDDASGRYVMRNSVNWCFITVDLAPLVIRTARVVGDQVEVELSDDGRERLRVETVRVAPDGSAYAYARGGTLLARFDRAAAFSLLEHAEYAAGGAPVLRLGDRVVPIGTLALGELPPPRPAAPSTPAADGGTRTPTP